MTGNLEGGEREPAFNAGNLETLGERVLVKGYRIGAAHLMKSRDVCTEGAPRGVVGGRWAPFSAWVHSRLGDEWGAQGAPKTGRGRGGWGEGVTGGGPWERRRRAERVFSWLFEAARWLHVGDWAARTSRNHGIPGAPGIGA